MSAPFTTEALLLKATDKGEDDRSVVLLTPDHGPWWPLPSGPADPSGVSARPSSRSAFLKRPSAPGAGGLFFWRASRPWNSL